MLQTSDDRRAGGLHAYNNREVANFFALESTRKTTSFSQHVGCGLERRFYQGEEAEGNSSRVVTVLPAITNAVLFALYN